MNDQINLFPVTKKTKGTQKDIINTPVTGYINSIAQRNNKEQETSTDEPKTSRRQQEQSEVPLKIHDRIRKKWI